MGNLCGEERREPTSLMQSKLCLSKLIAKTYIHILQGDILQEQSNAILNAAPEPSQTNVVKIRNLTVPPLTPGFPVIQPYQYNGIANIIHLKLPRSFIYDEYEAQIQSLVDAFEMASSKYIECISFTEPPKDITQSQPKDQYAIVLFQSFQFYALNNPNSRIKLLKVVNLDQATVNIYMKELLQVFIISQKQSLDQNPKENNIQQEQEIQKEETKTQIENEENKFINNQLEIQNNQSQQIINKQIQQCIEISSNQANQGVQQDISRKQEVAKILEHTQQQDKLILEELQIQKQQKEQLELEQQQQQQEQIQEKTEQQVIILSQTNIQTIEETKTTENEFIQSEFIASFSKIIINQVLEESLKKLIK